MKEFETIKIKINELENKKAELSSDLAELSQKNESSFEDLLLGKIEESEIDKTKEQIESLSEELKKIDEYIYRAKAVRRKLASEKLIPFAKAKRQEAAAAIQTKYDNQVENVYQARAAFLEELAKLGKITKEIGGVNDEYNQLMNDIGESGSVYGTTVNERIVIANGWTRPTEALGIEEKTQKEVYSSGIVPDSFKG